jgi:hypothetical protein
MEHPCGQLKIDFINQMGYFAILMQTYYAYNSPPLSQKPSRSFKWTAEVYKLNLSLQKHRHFA